MSPLYRDAARVRKIEHDDLLREITDAEETFAGWAGRLAATPGADARFLTRELDAVADRARLARIAIETTLHVELPADPDEDGAP